jgi:hypothetical protein
MEQNTRLTIAGICLVIMLILLFLIFLYLGNIQEPLSIEQIFGKIYEEIFGKSL